MQHILFCLPLAMFSMFFSIKETLLPVSLRIDSSSAHTTNTHEANQQTSAEYQEVRLTV